MPMYEYRCRACGAHFEELVRMGTPDSVIVCPDCLANESERQLSTFAAGGGATRTSFGSASAGGGCSPRGGFT